MGFGDSRRDCADARFGHQLDRNSSARIHVFQIVDELRQILNRINIVMRRRRNQGNARNRVAHARDDLIHFVSGKLAAFTGLRALRDLDLQLVAVHQIVRRDAEAPGCDLFHGAAPPVAV